MKSIIDEPVKKSFIERVNRISNSDKPQWGKMNAHEMVVHCSDQLKMSMGIIESEYIGKPVIGSLLKWLVLAGMPIPKGKVETVKELKQGVGGTKPVEFEKDKTTLIELINSFNKIYPLNGMVKHPAFGNMNYNQWAKLDYIHLNYHLTQFNR